jgi:hypothetical protein
MAVSLRHSSESWNLTSSGLRKEKGFQLSLE